MMPQRILAHPHVVRAVRAANPGLTRRQWAIGGAWFFVLASLFALLSIAFRSEAPGGDAPAVFSAADGVGNVRSIWLLTYGGMAGTILLWLEVAAVSIAAIATLLPVRRWKRLGHAVLIAWSAWWMIGAWWLAAITPLGFGLQAMLLTTLCGCTIYRAATKRDGRKTAEPLIRSSRRSPLFEPDNAASRASEQANEPPASPAATFASAASPAHAERDALHDFPTAPTTHWRARASSATHRVGRAGSRAVDGLGRLWSACRTRAPRLWSRLRDGATAKTQRV